MSHSNSVKSKTNSIANDFIYFARGKVSGLIKVGCSISPESRCKQLSSEHKEIVELLFAFPANYEIEQIAHDLLRISGAWASRGTEWYKNEGLVARCVEAGLLLKRRGVSFQFKPAIKV
jgi:hypothetical protein